MKLDVPYQSQEPLETTMDKKWCGIACLWMVMAYYLNGKVPKAEELVKEYGETFEFSGFLHRDLLKIARENNLKGFRKSWLPPVEAEPLMDKFREEGESEEDIKDWLNAVTSESLYTIKRHLDNKIPVIASVTPEFSPSSSTHLVVIIGMEGDNFVIHDPYKRGPNFEISEEDFKKYFLRQAIIIKDTSQQSALE